jgi:hypothetical protein
MNHVPVHRQERRVENTVSSTQNNGLFLEWRKSNGPPGQKYAVLDSYCC